MCGWFRSVVLALVGAVAVITAPIPLFAQTEATTGVIAGTVRDASGGVLPGVTVQIKNVDTALLREFVTDQDGRYRALLLPLGNYEMTAALSGFATLKRSGIRLGVGQELSIDLDMKVGEVAETVQVTAEAPVVEISRYERTQVINTRSIDALPINGRDFTDFVLLTPTASVQATNQGKKIAVGGGSEVTTGISVDGADYKSPFRGFQTGATSPFILSQEAVQEFEVVRAGFSAEFGRSQGGRINVVTKSGSNEPHGSGFYFYRNDKLAANDALGRQLYFGAKQFGGSLGGQMVRDKLFFFTAYDQQYFSTPLFQLLPDDLIAATDVVVPDLHLGNQVGQFSSTNDGVNWFWKTDYVLTPTHQISGRFNLLSASAQNVNGGPNRALGTQRAQITQMENVIITYNAVLGSKVNEFRFNYSRDNQPTVRQPLGTNFPTATVVVGGQTYTIGGEGTDLDPFYQNRTQLTDNFNYLVSKHDLKFGVDVNLTNVDEFFAQNARGQFAFLSISDFLARRPASFTQFVPLNGLTLVQAGTIAPAYKEVAVYGQDKYRVTSQLTVNYGLRWEAQINKDAKTNPSFPASGPIPDQLKNFAPRVGLAWDPTKSRKTAVRLGAGIFYARSDGIDTVRTFDTNGTQGARVTLTPTGPGGNLIPVFPAIFTNFAGLPPNAIPLLDITYVDPNFQLPRSEQWTAGVEHEIVPNLAISVDYEFSNTYHGNDFRNVNLFPSTRTDADGRPIYDTTVRPYPQFNRIQLIESTSRATYRAVSVSLEKRYSEHFQIQGSYTFARSFDDAGDSFNRVQGLVVQDSLSKAGEFGPSARDIRHRFVASSVIDLPWGFSVSQIATWQSGLPFNAVLPNDANRDGVFTDRPYINGQTIVRNAFRQPHYFDWDLRIVNKIAVPGLKGKTEAGLEFFNLTNSSNFTTTNTTYGTASFGTLNNPGAPFQMQLGVHYRF
jgi:hypothetical protein